MLPSGDEFSGCGFVLCREIENVKVSERGLRREEG